MEFADRPMVLRTSVQAAFMVSNFCFDESVPSSVRYRHWAVLDVWKYNEWGEVTVRRGGVGVDCRFEFCERQKQDNPVYRQFDRSHQQAGMRAGNDNVIG